LKEWCCDHHHWASSCYYDSVGAGREVDEKYIPAHNIYEHNRRKILKNRYIQDRDISGCPVIQNLEKKEFD